MHQQAVLFTRSNDYSLFRPGKKNKKKVSCGCLLSIHSPLSLWSRRRSEETECFRTREFLWPGFVSHFLPLAVYIRVALFPEQEEGMPPLSFENKTNIWQERSSEEERVKNNTWKNQRRGGNITRRKNSITVQSELCSKWGKNHLWRSRLVTQVLKTKYVRMTLNFPPFYTMQDEC